VDRLTPRHRPEGSPAGYQSWRRLLFLHWPVPAAAIARLLPPGLEVDTFEGQAWVGLVPFTMQDVRPRGLPAISLLSDFHELNLRTYVHVGGRNPGVWFFSLEAAKSIPVRIARAHWHLPYHRADMELAATGDEVRYRSERRWPGPLPASFSARWRIGPELGSAQPDTFEFFLAERYFLYAQSPGGLRLGQVHHTPYPLRSAEVLDWSEDLLRLAGLSPASGAPHALYSEGVDVEVFALRPLP
jgi:uncharacterized protein